MPLKFSYQKFSHDLSEVFGDYFYVDIFNVVLDDGSIYSSFDSQEIYDLCSDLVEIGVNYQYFTSKVFCAPYKLPNVFKSLVDQECQQKRYQSKYTFRKDK